LPYKNPKDHNRKRRENRAMEKMEEHRLHAISDRLWLANEVLGYDFTKETHAELFAQYPEFKPGVPWATQFPKRDVMVLWSRGHFKTTAVMVVLGIQAVLANPDIRIMLMQGSQKNTRERLSEIASHFMGTAKGSRFSDLFPKFCEADPPPTNGRKITKYGLQLTQDTLTTPARERKQLAQATFTVASPKTVKTGQHFDLGIFDDLVNDQNYRSKTLLKKVQEDFDMCFPLVDPGCPRFVSGTRYAFGDLYEVIQKRSRDEFGKDRGEWQISIKDCWKDDAVVRLVDDGDDSCVRFPAAVGRDGNSHGFTKKQLLQIMRDNPGMFATQYLNRPMLESQQILTKEDMLAATVIPTMVPPLSPPIIFVDLAAEGQDEPDDSVVLIAATDAKGVMYITGGNGGKWTIGQLTNNLVHYSLQSRPHKVMIEETASAKYFVNGVNIECLPKGIKIPLDYKKVNCQKDAKIIRIKAMATQVRNGRIKFFVGLKFWDKLVEQCVKYTGSKHQHDDYPDTVALAWDTLSVKSLSIPPTILPRPANDIIAILERDVVFNSPTNDYAGFEDTMGSEFV